MKTLPAAFLAVLLLLTSVRADDSFFPQIGATYSLSYASEPADHSRTWPTEVTVIQRGTGLWCLVEYEVWTTSEARRSPGEAAASKTPLSTKSKERLWINFGLLLGAKRKPADKTIP